MIFPENLIAWHPKEDSRQASAKAADFIGTCASARLAEHDYLSLVARIEPGAE